MVSLSPGLSTESFPFTDRYVKELLKLDDAQLAHWLQRAGLDPQMDPVTGARMFSHAELDRLKQALQDPNQQAPTPGAQTALLSSHGAVAPSAGNKPYASLPGDAINGRSSSNSAGGGGISGPSTVSVSHTAVTATMPSQDHLSVIIEAVSQAKDGILKDLARLLDDKLAGLDEVVVELIRAKTENDNLRQQLKNMSVEVDTLRTEVGRFKPVQFGFYRKVHGPA
jgi:DNA-binding transcriptional MerR regulator